MRPIVTDGAAWSGAQPRPSNSFCYISRVQDSLSCYITDIINYDDDSVMVQVMKSGNMYILPRKAGSWRKSGKIPPKAEFISLRLTIGSCQTNAEWCWLNSLEPGAARLAVGTSSTGSTVVYRWIGMCNMTKELKVGSTDDVCERWPPSPPA